MDLPTLLYRDDVLAVVNKPHGLLVHHPEGGADLLSALAPMLPWPRVHACHRLDAAAAGCLLVSAPGPPAGATTQLFAQRRIFKLYVALCRGEPAFTRTTVDAPLVQHGRRADVVAALEDEEPGEARPARTDLTVVAHGRGAFAVLAHTHSGRFHQVRAHLGHLGHPLLGDRVYGGGTAPTLGLHAVRLAFDHPLQGGARVDVVAPPWPLFVRTCERVGLTSAQLQACLDAARQHPCPEPA